MSSPSIEREDGKRPSWPFRGRSCVLVNVTEIGGHSDVFTPFLASTGVFLSRCWEPTSFSSTQLSTSLCFSLSSHSHGPCAFDSEREEIRGAFTRCCRCSPD